MTRVSIPIGVRRLRLARCRIGVQMFNLTGRLGGSIGEPLAAFLSHVVFDSHDFRTLDATSADRVFARRVKLSGTPSITDRTTGK